MELEESSWGADHVWWLATEAGCFRVGSFCMGALRAMMASYSQTEAEFWGHMSILPHSVDSTGHPGLQANQSFQDKTSLFLSPVLTPGRTHSNKENGDLSCQGHLVQPGSQTQGYRVSLDQGL